MKTLLAIITILLILSGAATLKISKSAIHEILAVLIFLGAIGSFGMLGIICRLEDIKEAVRRQKR